MRIARAAPQSIPKRAPLTAGTIRARMAVRPEYLALQSQLMDANIAQQTQQAQTGLLQKQIAEYTERVQRSPMAQRQLTNKTRDYSFLKAQYGSLFRRREDVRLRASLDAIEASSALQPIGVVYAHRVRPLGWVDPRLAGSIAAAMLLSWAALLARRRQPSGNAATNTAAASR